MGALGCTAAERMIEELLDDDLDEAGRAALDEHLAVCPSCQRFRRAAATMRDLLEDEPLVEPSPAALRRMRAGFERRLAAESAPRRPVSRRRRVALAAGLAAAAALLLVAAAVLVGRLGASGPVEDRSADRARERPSAVAEAAPPPPAVVRPAPPAPSEARLARGQAWVERGGARHRLGEGEGLSAGDRVETTSAAEGAALELGPGVLVALGPGSAIALTGLGDEDRAVTLESGRVACDVAPEGGRRRLEVRARETVVRVVGTLFAVETTEGGVEVRVLHGHVAVREGEGPEILVGGGQAGRFPEAEVLPLEERVATRDRALLAGEAPPPPSERAETVGEQFRRAEAARRRGDHAAAVALYRRIAASDRSGPSGGTALVSLGQLCLGPARRPAEARRAFSDYLARYPSGPMRQEALAGLIRAEASLGHAAAARAAASRYLAAYPEGRYAGLARDHVDERGD